MDVCILARAENENDYYTEYAHHHVGVGEG